MPAAAGQPDELRVLYADAALIVLDKPAGLLSVPGRGPDKQDCLSARAQQQFADALVVHRLDMATSGLIVMARGAAMQRRLSRDFAERRIGKRYQAVVHGRLEAPPQDWGLIDLPILADWARRPLRVIDASGQPSVTRWRVLAHETDAGGRPRTRLELEPVTGRTHQLRVHLQAIGHPIVGDTLYAMGSDASGDRRLLLHACALSFEHPETAQALNFGSAPTF